MATSASKGTATASPVKSAGNSSPAQGGASSTSAECATPKYTTSAPFIIHMGKVKRKKAKRIKKGRGSVLNQVDKAVQYADEHLEDDGKKNLIVPVVMLFERKRRNRLGWC